MLVLTGPAHLYAYLIVLCRFGRDWKFGKLHRTLIHRPHLYATGDGSFMRLVTSTSAAEDLCPPCSYGADCSKGYFTSKNCMRELVSSAASQKPIIALIDPDASRGGMSLDEVKTQLVEADELYAKWAFNEKPGALRGEALYTHLFAHQPIEWNRIGHFQEYEGEPQTHAACYTCAAHLLTRLDALILNVAVSPCA